MSAAPEALPELDSLCATSAPSATCATDPLVGQPAEAIDTPALVVDLDAMARNLARMLGHARQHGVRLRAHGKMHKCSAIGRWLMAHGAVGLCVQKTDEALAFARGGVNDLYISNEVIAPHKLARVAALAQTLAERGGQLAIAVDSTTGIERLAAAMAGHVRAGTRIDVFIELDVGGARCGVIEPAEVLALARAVAAQPALRLAGLQAAFDGAAARVRTALQACAAAGLALPLVTGAGTGTFVHEAASGLWGELQAGSFLFMDADYAANTPTPGQPTFEHALFVQAQVMSRRAGTGGVRCRAQKPCHRLGAAAAARCALGVCQRWR